MTIKISELGNVATIWGNVAVPIVSRISGSYTTYQANVDQIASYVTKAQTTFANVIPDADVVYSLGTATNRWKDLYLSGGTIFLGNGNLSISNNTIQSSLPITASDLTVSGNLTTGNINVTGDVSTANMSVTGTISAADITTTGTVTATDLTTTGTVTTANIDVSGTVTATTLNVSGPQIDFSQGSYIDETEVVGMTGTYGLALNSPEDGIVGMNALDANASVMSSMIVSNVSAQINVANVTYGGNVLVWFYDQNGSIQWPDETTQSTAFSDTYIATIADLDANAAMTSDVIAANVGMKGYVDNGVTTANVGMVGYVDNKVTTANVGMKGYVDATLIAVGGSSYGNANVAQFLPTYNGNIGGVTATSLISAGAGLFVFGNILAGYSLPTATFANVIFTGGGLANGYAQLNIQNLDSVGTQNSADFIATAPDGTDSSHYIDMGINGNNFSLSNWTISGADDGYLYVNSGNLTLGTDTLGTTVKVHVGGTLAENVVTTFANTGVTIGGNLTVSNVYVPTANNSVGTKGQISYDSSYVYVCIATNTWRRANLAIW